MLKLLNRYISLKFFIAILLVFLLFCLLILLIDFVELLRRSSKGGDIMIMDVLKLALLRVPSFAELTLPFAVLVGTIGAFLMLGRNSELIIIRAAGVSVWRFILPPVFVALIIGVFAVCVYNPLAAYSKAESERVYGELFGGSKSVLRAANNQVWFRQDGTDGPSVMNAKAIANQGLQLIGVTTLQYSKNYKFLERIDAKRADLQEGRWRFSDAWISRVGQQPQFFENYLLSTYLTPTQISDSMGSVETVSFWALPNYIEIANKAGLPATRYKIQYQLLLSKPFLLAIMVLIAATCSLRTFRLGRIQTMIIMGMCIGIGFFIFAETSRQFGLAEKVAPEIAAWVPLFAWGLIVLTVLLHQEDG
ncbi:MAG: LPS export ABC transporter permease LptG [Rhodomicrobium sp.]|nr:MAG: LPS export ABC transporter permease LptG [Rhodomicrobium sp.]